MSKIKERDRPCKHEGCTNHAYSRYHTGWEKWIYSSECKTCTSLLEKYGIHTGDRTQIMEAQNGQCAICYSTIEFQQGKGLSSYNATVDHDHETQTVRGILCGSCNNMLGRAQDNPAILRNALEYLETHGKT